MNDEAIKILEGIQASISEGIEQLKNAPVETDVNPAFDWDAFDAVESELAYSHMSELNRILVKLAKHFNPDGWVPDYGHCSLRDKWVITFDPRTRQVEKTYTMSQVSTPVFHRDAVSAAMVQLEVNRDKWEHLLGWENLRPYIDGAGVKRYE